MCRVQSAAPLGGARKFVDESATPHDGSGGQATLTVTPTAQDVSGGDGGPTHDPDYLPGQRRLHG